MTEINQTTAITIAIIIVLLIWCYTQMRKPETLLTPPGFAPTQADLVELAMRADMFNTR